VSHLDVAQNEPAPSATSLLSVSLVEQGPVGATLCVRADEECIGVITYRTVAVTSAIWAPVTRSTLAQYCSSASLAAVNPASFRLVERNVRVTLYR